MRLALAFTVPAVLVGSVSLAQTPAPMDATATPTAPGVASADPAPSPARPPSAYALAILEGLAKLREGQPLAAQLAFQRAVAADGNASEAHYYLAVAQFRNGSQNHSLETFRVALRVAQQANDLMGEARARYAIAESLEHVHGRGRHADPRAAWQELLVFAESHPEVVAPEVPRAHLAAHARIAELEAANEPVRHRIRDREREAARGAR